MQRRRFIKNTVIATSGLLITNYLLACSRDVNAIQLDNIIGESEDLLMNFTVEGDEFFAYYNIPRSSFRHTFIEGDQAFIYCQKGEIVGYTISIKGIQNTKEYIAQFSQKYGSHKLVYENTVGKELKWENNDKKILLSFSNNDSELSQHTYFSETLMTNRLIVF